MARPKHKYPMFGVLAEFAGEEELIGAITSAKDHGFRHMEAYTPVPSHEVVHAIGHKNRLPLIVLLGGITGGLAGFAMQYWMSVESYPLNVGGRPFNSWPAFIVVVFEMTILFAAGAAVFGMLALNGLPRPYHPVFHVDAFQQASRNRFFLLLLSRDPVFEPGEARRILDSREPLSLHEVPW
jgi:hypothetical protein